MASLAFLVWFADRGEHDRVAVRPDVLPTGGCPDRTLEDWTCREPADKHGLGRWRFSHTVKHTRHAIDVIKGDRPRHEIPASLGMAGGTG